MEEYTKEDMLEYMNSVAVLKQFDEEKHLGEPKYWASKTDGSYITYENLIMDCQWMKRKNITEQLQSHDGDGSVVSLGFNPIEQKWYGWSHRAVFGFGIGSETKFGDCGYQPDSEENFIKSQVDFWMDEYNENVLTEVTEKNGKKGLLISYTYSYKTPNEGLRGLFDDKFIPFPEKWGKGEWTAETLEDAKQMAIDFAESVG